MPGWLASTSPRLGARLRLRVSPVTETVPWAKPSADSGWACTMTSSMVLSDVASTDTASAESGGANKTELRVSAAVAALRALRWQEIQVEMGISTPCANRLGLSGLLGDIGQCSAERELWWGSPRGCCTVARRVGVGGWPVHFICKAEGQKGR